MRKLASLVALVVMSLLAVSLVSALDPSTLTMTSVEVNGDIVYTGGALLPSVPSVLSVEEGQTIRVRVGVTAPANAALEWVEDVEVDVKIAGYEFSDEESLSDSTPLFNLKTGTTKYVTLEVVLPKQLDRDSYTLRLRLLDKNSTAISLDIPLYVEPARHGIEIADVSFSPSTTQKAGRAFLVTVLLENFGDKDEDDVKVTVSIPELGASASKFVDVVETKNHNVDRESLPEFFLQTPANAEDGDYEVLVTAKYNDLRKTVSKKFTVRVQADERFQTVEAGPTVLAAAPELQNVQSGKTALFGIALSNTGKSSKAYVVQQSSVDWATVSVSDSVVVLGEGQSKVVYVEVTPSATASAGEHLLSVAVKSGSETLETVSFRANVVGAAAAQTSGQAYNLRNGLEVALIVLVVLLVIVGLVIGFSRMRKDNGEEKTYY